MAVGDIYTEQQVDEELDKQLPNINRGKELPIPRELAKALFMAENMGNSGGVTFANRVSPKGAGGVAQVMPETLQGLIKTGYLPPTFNVDMRTATFGEQVTAGLAAMREFVDRRKTTDPKKVAALYNAGDGGASTFLKTGDAAVLPKETQGYLSKVERALTMMGLPIPTSPANVKPSPAFATSPLQAAQQAATHLDMVSEVQKALFGANQQVQAAGQKQIAALEMGAQAAGQQATLQAEQVIAEQQVHQKIISSLGLDVTDPNSDISQELFKSAKARKTREEIGGKIAELQSKSLFSDPLDWMGALAELPQLVPIYNQQANIENDANAQVTRMQQVAAQAKSLIPAKSADLIRAKAQADGQAALANAQASVAQINAQNASGQAKLVLDMFTLERNRFQDVLGLESRELAIQDRQEGLKLRKNKAEQEEEEKKRDTALLTGINLFRKMIAGNVPDYTQADIKSMPGAIRDAWHRVVLRGGFGNYQEAIEFIDEFGNPAGAAAAGNATMMQLVRNIKTQAATKVPELQNKIKTTNPLAKVDSKTVQSMVYQQLYEETVQYANKGFDKSFLPTTSPYAIDYDAIAATAASNKQQSLISEIVLREKQKAPFQSLNATMNAKFIVNAVEAEVKAGKVAPAKAAQELSLFYKAASDNIYVNNGLKYIGLPKFQDYVITTGAVGKNKIDLFNPSQVENYLTAQVASEKRRSAAVEAGVNFPFGTDPFGIMR